MSQTTQFVSVPLAEGQTSVGIASTAWGVGGARVEDGRIKFAAGPDMIGATYVLRRVLVQESSGMIPSGFQSAGEIMLGSRKLSVLVELPTD